MYFLKFAAGNILLITCLQSGRLLFTVLVSSLALKIKKDMVWDAGVVGWGEDVLWLQSGTVTVFRGGSMALQELWGQSQPPTLALGPRFARQTSQRRSLSAGLAGGAGPYQTGKRRKGCRGGTSDSACQAQSFHIAGNILGTSRRRFGGDPTGRITCI